MNNSEHLRALYAALDGLLTDLDANGSPEAAAASLKYHLRQRGLVIRAEASTPTLDVERLAKALHPKGQPATVDCCMGSTVKGLYEPDEAERRHREYHHRDAERLAAEYARLSHQSEDA